MNFKITNTHDEFKANLRGIVTKRWDEEKKKAAIPYEEIYKKMVNEAVLVIKDAWERDAKYSNDTKHPADSVKLESLNSFFITEEDRMLYSANGFRTINPKTGVCCFYSACHLKSEEDVKKYVQDVLALLPEGTTYTETEVTEVVFGKAMRYSFFLTLDMQ